MPVVIPCGKCQKPLTLPETLLGKSIKCPLCASVFQAQGNGVKTPSGPTVENKTAPRPTSDPVKTPRALVVPCTSCKKALTLPETLVGKSIKCPTCATVFVAQKPAAVIAGSAPEKPATPPKSAGVQKVVVSCSHCKKSVTVAENLLGKALKCPLCAKVFQASVVPPSSPGTIAVEKKAAVASPPVAPPPAAPYPTTAPAVPSPAVPPPVTGVSGSATIRVACGKCKKPLKLPESALGKTIKCPHCTAVFQVPKTKSTPAALPPVEPVKIAAPAPVAAPPEPVKIVTPSQEVEKPPVMVGPPPRLQAETPAGGGMTVANASGSEAESPAISAATPSTPVDDAASSADKVEAKPIHTRCAKCRRVLRLPASAVGKAIRCPGCASTFVVKAAPASAAAPPTKEIEAAPAVAAAAPPTKEPEAAASEGAQPSESPVPLAVPPAVPPAFLEPATSVADIFAAFAPTPQVESPELGFRVLSGDPTLPPVLSNMLAMEMPSRTAESVTERPSLVPASNVSLPDMAEPRLAPDSEPEAFATVVPPSADFSTGNRRGGPTTPLAEDVPMAAPVEENVLMATPLAEDVTMAAPVEENVLMATPLAEDVPMAAPVQEAELIYPEADLDSKGSPTLAAVEEEYWQNARPRQVAPPRSPLVMIGISLGGLLVLAVAIYYLLLLLEFIPSSW